MSGHTLNHMVEHSQHGLDATFAALADPTRRAILARLATGDRTVSELAEPFDMSLAAVSKHVGVLVKSDLVLQRKQGRERRCHLNSKALRDAHGWIEFYRRFWEDSLESLARYVESQDNDKKRRGK